MSATANDIYRKIGDLQNGLIELRALLADLEIPNSTIAGQEHRPRTGWRFVRGEGSGTYIRDPQGTDRLPPGYTVEAAQGALEYARPADLQAAVVQGGHADLREALERFTP